MWTSTRGHIKAFGRVSLITRVSRPARAGSDELWTGLIKNMYEKVRCQRRDTRVDVETTVTPRERLSAPQVELRLRKEKHFPKSNSYTGKSKGTLVTSVAREDWKTAWRVTRAKELLTQGDEVYGTWRQLGLQMKALLVAVWPLAVVVFARRPRERIRGC